LHFYPSSLKLANSVPYFHPLGSNPSLLSLVFCHVLAEYMHELIVLPVCDLAHARFFPMY
ncbi:hypothetical protein, partial [Rahnella aquatilis]|uniref:hypothetical protein n=1 Tax=Rahnella aquatilis TaxID=34038 RepID=UPI001B806CEA